MTEAIRDWILQLTGTALLSAVALAVTPQGKVRRVVTIVCGFAVLAALLRLGGGFDYTAFSQSLARQRSQVEAYTENFAEENKKLTRQLIEEECAAYILDKGDSLGIAGLEVRVWAVWSEEGYWYPSQAALSAPQVEETQKKDLSAYIESELGIPAAMQEWSTDNEDKGT